MLVTLHGILETYAKDTLNLGTGVVVGIIRLVIVLILLAEVHTAGKLTDADEVGILHQLGTQGRLVHQALEGLHGADIGKEAQLLAHSQQTLLGTHLGGGVIVKLGVTHGREEHGIGLLAHLEGLFGEGVAHLIDGMSATQGIFVAYVMSKLLTYGGHYIHTHGGYFGADTVTGQHSNLKVHTYNRFLLLSIFHLEAAKLQFFPHIRDVLTDFTTKNL